ncbi:MAG TPA: alpha/beta hydrolase [Thermoplasmata archaeon]|nr:alpha/beta hydrolase [Thermoplasmata archaeon]
MSSSRSRATPPTRRARRVDVGGYRLWVKVAGSGSPTIVFESGGGDNSSVWSSIEAKVREEKEVSTVIYDRAGLGKSEPKPGPYRIDDEVSAFRAVLDACRVPGPIVLVAHSYGGFVSILTAAADPRVAGIVLVEGNVPGFFDDAEVARLLSRFTPQIPMFQKMDPAISAVMVPLMQALPETARRLSAVSLPLELPVIDIVAETTWIEAPEEVAALRREHALFVAASPSRQAVFARGSGHYVMHDKPDLVVDAISRLVDRLRREG